MTIERINESNYCRFADMVFWRENGYERKPAFEPVPVDLGNPNLYVFAAEDGGRFVGWISLVYIPKVGKWKRGHIYVDELWIQPDYRRRGIAKELLGKADELKQLLDTGGIRLYVNTENPGALKLYEGCGFYEKGSAYFMERPE